MARFALSRILQAIPLMIVVILLVFVLLQFTPGDPVQALVGQYPVPPDFRAAIASRYHLDDPLPTRLLTYFANLLSGDLGYSFQSQRAVSGLILERAPRTLLLAAGGFLVGIPVGMAVGVISATSRNRHVDRFWTTTTLIAYAIPGFWLGQLLVIVFAMQLGWLPTQGMAPLISRAGGMSWLLERARYLALPAITYAIYEATRVARLMRASVVETLGQGYITTARAKGLSRSAIIGRHVLRNSSLPVVTVMGYAFGVAMGGAVLIETVFSWPGIGLLLVEAIRARDNQVVVGVVLFVSFAVIVMNLIVDLLYCALDPRIRATS
ncbi:peptide/nickel transport system permease protein [Rhizobiales bacterium GAS191]|jgi:peptide/nickel transport system permease protein|nr:peptide/nickel transport system permease protein [Rhizobiales bacterium GAS113]SEB86424.1 peptide/nickel transport system permease protein [Rhizobiales bacterium GAS188]SED37848.1 peptide/nickel transport system permease protein [Rhizobiales bacterium GAS191]